MGQRTWAGILSLTVLLLVLGLNISKTEEKVFVASHFAIYDQLKHLLPKSEKVSMLIPFGQDSHSFQASPKNIANIIDSKGFFYTSKGMDTWVKKLKILDEASNLHDISSSIAWLDGHEEEHHKGNNHSVDPHYWLDVNNQKTSAKYIYEILKERFTENTKELAANYQTYLDSLDTLDKNYQEKLQNCKQSKLFVTHDAFTYLENQGFFSVESIVGLAPQSSPNPARIKTIMQELKGSKVKTIFFESFISDKMAKVIAKELDIEIDVLDTFATISAKQAKSSVTYNSLMRDNLDKFSKALQCP